MGSDPIGFACGETNLYAYAAGEFRKGLYLRPGDIVMSENQQRWQQARKLIGRLLPNSAHFTPDSIAHHYKKSGHTLKWTSIQGYAELTDLEVLEALPTLPGDNDGNVIVVADYSFREDSGPFSNYSRRTCRIRGVFRRPIHRRDLPRRCHYAVP